MILVDSVYINNSGGKFLLEYFIRTLIEKRLIENYYFLIDERLSSEYIQLLPGRHIIVKASEYTRRREYTNLKNKAKIQKVLTLNNIPPPITLECPVYIFFQNVLLIDANSYNLGFRIKLQFYLKSLYSKFLNKKNYVWLVQTELNKQLLEIKYKIKQNNVNVLPFFDPNIKINDFHTLKEEIFIYIAHGIKYKNHKLLFTVWKKLANEFNLFPILVVTIDKDLFPELSAEIIELNAMGLNIQNVGQIDKIEINKLYSRAKYLIYPSLTESFGLPLIEAVSFDCKVISIDLPYIRQVVTPSLEFDPNDCDDLTKKLKELIIEKFELKNSTINVKDEIDALINILQ